MKFFNIKSVSRTGANGSCGLIPLTREIRQIGAKEGDCVSVTVEDDDSIVIRKIQEPIQIQRANK